MHPVTRRRLLFWLPLALLLALALAWLFARSRCRWITPP
jgi:hypothetical protein